jgi:thioredoxin-related protein
VILYFYQDGCPYCAKLLQDNFGQKEIADKTQKHFDVIAINMWGNKEVTDFNGSSTNEKRFAQSLKVHFTPTMLFLNEEGKVVFRLNGYFFPQKFSALLDYVSQKKENTGRFAAYFNKISPVKTSAKLNYEKNFLKPPYDFKKILAKHKKPLLVLFEQTRCRACDELHKDILKRKYTQAEMKKLSVTLVDMWSKDKIVTPDGKTMTVKEWAKKLNINHSPSLVFFDTSGKEVFRTEAYLKSFHIHGAMAYVHEKAYNKYKNFQRFLQARREMMIKKGEKVDLMK